MGRGLGWLGRHFTIQFVGKQVPARPFTTCLALTEENLKLRKCAVQLLETGKWDMDTMEYAQPRETMPFIIKRYPAPKGFSQAIHKVQPSDSDFMFRLDGPMSRGLELGKEDGTIAIFGAGTGMLPFLDFIQLLLLKTIHQILKDDGKAEQVEELNKLGVDFDCVDIKNLKVKVFGAFSTLEDSYGLDIFVELAKISKKYKKDVFDCVLTNFGDENIQKLKSHFDQAFLTQNVKNDYDRYLICGPPKMNRDIPKHLKNMGVAESKITIV